MEEKPQGGGKTSMSRKFNSITIKVSYLTKALYEVSFAYDGLGCTKFSTQLDAGWHSGYGLRNTSAIVCYYDYIGGGLLCVNAQVSWEVGN